MIVLEYFVQTDKKAGSRILGGALNDLTISQKELYRVISKMIYSLNEQILLIMLTYKNMHSMPATQYLGSLSATPTDKIYINGH